MYQYFVRKLPLYLIFFSLWHNQAVAFAPPLTPYTQAASYKCQRRANSSLQCFGMLHVIRRIFAFSYTWVRVQKSLFIRNDHFSPLISTIYSSGPHHHCVSWPSSTLTSSLVTNGHQQYHGPITIGSPQRNCLTRLR